MSYLKRVGWGPFRLPGEKRRALAYARDLLRLVERLDAVEDVVSVDLNYAELCALMDSGTVAHGSSIYNKLRAARDAFQREPKVYGKGLKRKAIK